MAVKPRVVGTSVKELLPLVTGGVALEEEEEEEEEEGEGEGEGEEGEREEGGVSGVSEWCQPSFQPEQRFC